MRWQSVRIITPGSRAEALADTLLDFGALSVGVEDAHEGTDRGQLITGEPGASTEVWQESVVEALFDESAPVNRVLEDVAARLAVDPFTVFSIHPVHERDWVRETQAQFKPMRVTRRLWVIPSWHAVPADAEIPLLLDPGLAFGTGTHPTTRLMLEWLETTVQGGETVLDYGCGSGILAIAAMKLGAREAVGVDIDPQAVKTSGDNARANGVNAVFYGADQSSLGQADVIVANILANPLILLAPLLAAHANLGAQLALSGILKSQAEAVASAYFPWFDLSAEGSAEDWVCLAGSRRADHLS